MTSSDKATPPIPEGYLTGEYLAYQERYAKTLRDSDRQLIDVIDNCLSSLNLSKPARLMDVGTSTGNLLLHLRDRFPSLQISGSDVFQEVIERCQSNPALNEFEFEVINVLNAPVRPIYDIVVFNAVTHFFSEADLQTAFRNLAGLLKPSGWLVGFGLLNPFEQTLLIHEISAAHPEGAVVNIHNIPKARNFLQMAGFESAVFRPFEISIDLDHPSSMQDLKSYTRTADDGRRMNFRGSLFQPWHHFWAQKRP